MVSKTLVRTKVNDRSDRDDFLPRDAGRAEVADKLALKPLIGVNVDYRSARKDSPAFSILARATTTRSPRPAGYPWRFRP